uniref:Transposase DDE domain group 1 n=1 Tax=Candidatus Kentrum sp. DK TaxID=2126562 RepID=A0A450T759_9GAMM|nr:MAG: Transposase DDE domain group 1 [Candidatus Kentron sp. DK]
MRTFKLEQSDKEITSHAGMALIGAAINKYTSLTKMIDAALPKRHGTSTSDMVKTTIGLLAQAKSDFQAINNVRDDEYFHQALDLQKSIPTDTSIRTRYEKEANKIAPIVNQASVDFLVNSNAPVSALSTGHIPLDIDVTPHDNSNTKKEGVSYTYKGMDGYAPIACYLGMEGWSVRYELRPGSQHSQCDFIPTLDRTLAAVHPIMEKQPLSSQMLLIRLDSAHDSKETRTWHYEAKTPLLLDFIINRTYALTAA